MRGWLCVPFTPCVCRGWLLKICLLAGAAGHSKQAKRGREHDVKHTVKHTDFALAQELPHAWCVRPLVTDVWVVRRRQSGSLSLGALRRRLCYIVLVAQQVLRRASYHVGLSIRGAGRLGRMMCLGSVGMHNICDSCMHLGTCREVGRPYASWK